MLSWLPWTLAAISLLGFVRHGQPVLANANAPIVAPHLSAQGTLEPRTRAARAALYFEKNIGQAHPGTLYSAVTPWYHLALRKHDMLVNYRVADSESDTFRQFSIAVDNVSPNATLVAERQLPSYSSYFHTRRTSRWRTQAPHFERLRYASVLPGIDLSFYAQGQLIEYDFTLEPGASPETLQLRYTGIDQIELAANGDALLTSGKSTLRQSRPVAYQIIDGQTQSVPVRYRLIADETARVPRLGFAVGHYNPNHPLIIDPILSYSTLLGGDLFDAGTDVALDSEGYVYLLSHAYQPTGGSDDTNPHPVCNSNCQSGVVISKFTPDGQTLLWKTTLSGSGDDIGRGIRVNADGEVYLAGWTTSDNFPLRRASDSAFDGSSEGFVAKISANGSKLVFSSYLGNNRSEVVTAFTRSEDGSLYVVGRSSQPVADETSNTPRVATDGFITKYKFGERQSQFTRYLKGIGYDTAEAVAVDPAGDVYITGITESFDFPLKHALQKARRGASDGYLVKLSSSGEWLYSTLLGGNGADAGQALVSDAQGQIWVGGITTSRDLTPAAISATPASAQRHWDGFLQKYTADGTQLLVSKRFGGSHNDYLTALAVDDGGQLHVAGHTHSTDFPHTAQPKTPGEQSDVFYAQMDADAQWMHSQYIGGNADDSHGRLALTNNGDAILSGITRSDPASLPSTAWFPSPQLTEPSHAFISTVSVPRTQALVSGQWNTLSPSESQGGPRLQDVLGDDIPGRYGHDWFVYHHVPETGVYAPVLPDDRLLARNTYHVFHTTGTRVYVDFPHPTQPLGTFTDSANSRCADAKTPCPGGWLWAETPAKVTQTTDIEGENDRLACSAGDCAERIKTSKRPRYHGRIVRDR